MRSKRVPVRLSGSLPMPAFPEMAFVPGGGFPDAEPQSALRNIRMEEAERIAQILGASIAKSYSLGVKFRWPDGRQQCLHSGSPIWQALATMSEADDAL